MSDEEEESLDDEAWREYPIWLQAAVKDESNEKTVRILDADPCGDAPKNNRVRVKVIEMPDTLEHAAGNVSQRHKIQQDSVVLVTADPGVQPYIGLITKLWLDRDAPFETRDGVKWYSPQNLWFEMYYFYRFTEAPADRKGRLMARRQSMAGGVIGVASSATGKTKRVADDGSERQVMFSNHGTWHDNEGICAESFLYTKQVHWLGETEKFPVEYFEGRDGLLRQRLARGFVCRFMNYIKTHVSEGGEVYALAEAWPDPVTFAIARRLRAEYRERARELAAKNERMLAKHRAARDKERQKAAAAATPPRPPSPQLPGAPAAASGGGGKGGGGAGRVSAGVGAYADDAEDGMNEGGGC